jgi:hypothetical protein
MYPVILFISNLGDNSFGGGVCGGKNVGPAFVHSPINIQYFMGCINN